MKNPLASLAFAAALTGCETGTPLEQHAAAQDPEVAAGLKSFGDDCRALTTYWENSASTNTGITLLMQESADNVEAAQAKVRKLEWINARNGEMSPENNFLMEKELEELEEMIKKLEAYGIAMQQAGATLQRGKEVDQSQALAARAAHIRAQLKGMGLEVSGTLMCNVDLARFYGSDPVSNDLTVTDPVKN